MSSLKRYNGTDWERIGIMPDVAMSPQTLGYSEFTNAPTTTSGTDVVLTSVTVTVPEGRRLRITGYGYVTSSVSGTAARIAIKEGSTFLADGGNTLSTTAEANPIAIISPSAGTHTYDLTWRRQSGTGTLTFYGASTVPGFLLVEDITGSTLPYQPASVPVGLLGQAIRTSDFGIASATPTDIPGFSLNVAVPAGRILKLNVTGYAYSTVANDRLAIRFLQDGVMIREGVDPDLETTSGDMFHMEHLLSPTEGAHTYKVQIWRTSGTGTVNLGAHASSPSLFWIEDITPTPAPSSGAPGSTLGYAETGANQSFTSLVDLNDLAVTVTVPAGRRLKITGMTYFTSTVPSDTVDFRIREGSTSLKSWQQIGGFNFASHAQVEHILTPSAGTHTYKLSALRSVGSGTISSQPGAFGLGYTAYILVEDITGSVWPEGSEVTAGLIASEAYGAWTPSIVQSVTPAQTVNNSGYMKFGRMVHVYASVSFSGAGTANQVIRIHNLPFAIKNNSEAMGSYRYFDAGNTNHVGVIRGGTGTTAELFRDGDGNALGAMSHTIASGDTLQFMMVYEATS